MKDNRIHLFFEDWSINSEYEILEEGKNTDELKEIAIKKGLKVPSKDLAIFKCKYAMVDAQNKNKCTLPKKEVKKSLKTLNGKAIDKDHLRKSTIGYWLDAELDDDVIIAYGAFWKSNFPEDYIDIKERMQQGHVKISFEAWGDRQFKEDGSYDLTDIEFAGGALLFDTQPAFPDAEVMEFSTNRVLEFAKIIETKEVETDGGSSKMEEAKFSFLWDDNTIARMMVEAKCPSCESNWFDVNNINFDGGEMDVTCGNCSAKSKMALTPQMTLTKKGKKVDKASTEQKSKVTSSGEASHSNEKGGCKIVDESLKKFGKGSVEELVKFIDETLATVSSKEAEIAELKKTIEESKLKIENSKIELEKVTVEAAAVKAELDKRVAAEKASLIKTRRDELTEEFAKDLTDEDIMVDLKFENAKLKKDLSVAKKAIESASTKAPVVGMEAGAKETPVPEIYAKQKNIQDQAFTQ